MPVFKKALVHNGDIYVGLYLYPAFLGDEIEDIPELKDWAAVVKFNPEMKTPFTIIFDKIPLKLNYDMNFAIDRQGNIWTISY